MHHRIARSLFILLCGVLATALGVAGALLFTPPGRSLLARLLSDQAPHLMRGSVQIGGVRGGWLRGFTLDSVVIRDTSGALLLSAHQVEVHYTLANLLAGRLLLSGARVVHPDIQLIKHRAGGRLNYEEIFRLGEGPAGGASPLIEIRDLVIEDGRLTIRLPWNPDGRLHDAARIDSALAYERTKPGRRIEPGPEGLELVRTISGLDARLPLLRIATPDRKPVALEIATLAARISDPALDVRDLRGTIQTKNDSLVFALEHFELPGTTGQGSGRLDWPSDTLLYHFGFRAPRLALADLRFISPNFPDFTGSARVQASSLSTTRTEYDIRELAVGNSATHVSGRLVAVTDVYRGLGFRNLNLNLDNLDLEVVRPYLDTLPFYGRISGPLEADGFFDDMRVAFDWRFQDAKVPGGAENHVSLNGRLALGGAEGILFRDAELRPSDLDLRTVRLLAPAVILEGRLGLAGSLNGPLKNVVFQGSAEQRDEGRPASRLNGRVRLDTRGELLGLETDVVLDSLSFEGIRRAFPTLRTQGKLGGRVKLAGYLDHLAVDAQVGGELGRITAQGQATVLPPRWGADSLRLTFQQLDLATLAGRGPATSLQGNLLASGTVDSAVAPAGRLVVTLGPSRIREVLFDSAVARLQAHDSLLVLDTARVFWNGGQLSGSGSLGWIPPKTGKLSVRVEAEQLASFDSLALNLSGFTVDTLAGERHLQGSGHAELTLEGALGALQLQLAATLDSVRWLAYRAKQVQGTLAWHSPGVLEASVTADSLWRRTLVLNGLGGAVSGRSDSLRWSASGSSKELATLSAGGRLQQVPGGRLFHVDSLHLELLGREWELQRPLNARLSDSLVALDTVRFVTRDGSGSIELAGELPRSGPGELAITALGIQLRDIYGLTQRDTAGIGGVVAVDARLSGTARAPELRGSGTITGPVFGDFQAPLMRAAFDYRQQVLKGNLTFWRTGKPVVEADLTLPLDLALRQVPKRQLPGPLSIVVHGDSIDLALAEAFTPNLRQVGGQLNVDAHIQGTWESPRLTGEAQLIEGSAYVPGLGVRYQSVNGKLRLAQDSILAEGLRIATREGTLELSGGIRLERLTTPVLNLAMATRNFELINVRDYLTLQSTGNVQLTGTLTHPVLTGRGRLTNSVIYFADLVQKEIVNLEDPLFRDLADTLVLRKYSLGANFQSRFLDSLAVRDLQFELGEGVWLRSNEANFQLEGRLLVNKTRQIYRIDGDLDVPRGTYTLKAGGIINRTFTVDRGTVRYFGDLNAELDVEARHVVRTPESPQDIPVIVHITGTLLVPQLTLTSASDRTPLSEAQLISLLALGSTDPLGTRLGSSSQTGFAAAAFATSALSSELQRALISDLGVPVNLIEIRTPLASSGLIGGTTSSPWQLAIGKALTEKLFVTANAGFCFGSSQAFSAQNLGASLEYRFRRSLQARLTAEPVQTCLLGGVNVFGATRRYQFGAELRWNRDY